VIGRDDDHVLCHLTWKHHHVTCFIYAFAYILCILKNRNSASFQILSRRTKNNPVLVEIGSKEKRQLPKIAQRMVVSAVHWRLMRVLVSLLFSTDCSHRDVIVCLLLKDDVPDSLLGLSLDWTRFGCFRCLSQYALSSKASQSSVGRS
jgi:hypothetical protein